MENIEEHCEEDIHDSEVDPLIDGQAKQQSFPQSLSPLSSTTSTSCAKTNCISTPSGTSNDTLSGSETNLASDIKVEPASRTTPRFGPSTQTITSSVSRRMPHTHRLEKKHSSGDLHSRLKTRKLLGVGETDDGDIHRSKLSQILGHSDQLYIRLPYGLRIWQLIMAVMFTATGLWALIVPSQIFHTTFETGEDHAISLPLKLYGGAVISLSIVYWMTLNSQDRDIIRMCLLSSIVYYAIQFVVTSGHWLFSSQSVTRNSILLMSFCGIILLISCFYHWALTQRRFFTIKRCASSKDISREK